MRIVSGNRYTPTELVGEDPESERPLLALGPPNSARMPTFHRLDVRVDKTWRFSHWRLTFFLDVQNSYNAANVEAVSYDARLRRETYFYGLPLIPSLGLRGDFG